MRGTLRIGITAQDTYFFALGFEIDYAAQGRTLVEVLEAFALGFNATVDANMQRFGTLEHFFKPAPEHRYSAGNHGDRHVGIVTVELDDANHIVRVEAQEGPTP